MARVITLTPDPGVIIEVTDDGVPSYRDRIHPAEAQGKTNAQLRQIAAARHDAWKAGLATRPPRPSKAERRAEIVQRRERLREELRQADEELEAVDAE